MPTGQPVINMTAD